MLSTFSERYPAHFIGHRIKARTVFSLRTHLQRGHVDKCTTGTSRERSYSRPHRLMKSMRIGCILRGMLARIGVPRSPAETRARLGPDVRASGPSFVSQASGLFAEISRRWARVAARHRVGLGAAPQKRRRNTLSWPNNVADGRARHTRTKRARFTWSSLDSGWP